jgi:MFS family permease
VNALLRNLYAELPPVYWTIWLGTLVNKLGSVVVPFLALYLTQERGLPNAEAGALLSLYGAGSILAGLTGGVLADRHGRRLTLIISLLGGAAASLGIGFARSLGMISLLTFLLGWLGEMYRPAVAALISDVVPPEKRTRAFGLLYWVVNLGFAVAMTLGGVLASTSFLGLFVFDAVTMALYGLLVLWKVPETRPTERHHGAAQAGLGTVLQDGTFLLFVLLAFGFALVMWQTGTSAPIDMTAKGLSKTTYGVLFAINGVLIAVLQPRMTSWLTHKRRDAVLAVAALWFGVGFGLFGFVSSVLGYAVGIAIWTIGEIAYLPTANTVVADLAPSSLRGRYQGVYTMAWGFASVAAPVVGGAALDGPGSRTLWVGCAVLMAGIAVCQFAIGPAIARRAAK